MAERPTGTVTFLFTDLEGSTRLWEDHPDAMGVALKRHDELLQSAVEAHSGYLVKTTGDGIHAAFATAEAGVSAAVAAQAALLDEAWDATGPLKVRMGLHTGAAELRDGDYYGPALNRAARLMAVAHGGQIVISKATEELVRDGLSTSVGLEDLGEHRLRDLGRPERVFQVNAPGLPNLFGPLRSLDTQRTNLPAQATAFIGRTTEVGDTIEALRECRLVTLTGVGGVGKTRLALQVAAEVLPEHHDGVWLVELGGVTDVDAIEEAVASALTIVQQPGETIAETLLSFLRNKRTLLVVDNCEHLLGGVATLVESILAVAPGVKVLATSREPLTVRGERILGVPSLSVPDERTVFEAQSRTDAVELFVERARAARSGFTLTSDNADAVAQLCRRLDGIPLAIELAAARVRSMSANEIADRLDHRFRLLTGSVRSATSRHQTLRSAIDWSYDLLDDAERELLARLSVCVGGFDLVAAEKIGAGDDIDALEVDDVLSRLVDKSLVIASEHGSGMRYRMLETIRAYAVERLEGSGEIEQIRRRHADHYAAFAVEAGAGLKGADERAWVERVDQEFDNLRAAVSWTLDGEDVSPALVIVSSLALQGLRIEATVCLWAAGVVARSEPEQEGRFAVALALLALSKHRDGDADEAIRSGREAVALIRRSRTAPLNECRVLSLTAQVMASSGHNPHDLAVEWVDAARLAGDVYEEALALNMLALGQMFEGEAEGHLFGSEEATSTAEAGVACAIRSGSPSARAFTSFMTALTLLERDTTRAASLLEDAVRLAREADNDFAHMVALGVRTGLLSRAGDHLGAARDSLVPARRALAYGHRSQQASQLWVIAGSLAALDRPEPAAVLMGWVDSVAAPHEAGQGHGPGGAINFFLTADGVTRLAELTATLGPERHATLTAAGRAMSDEAALRYAEDRISALHEGQGIALRGGADA